MSKNEFSESSCNGSEISSDPELCLNEEFSLFEEFSRLTSKNSQGPSENLKNLLVTLKNPIDPDLLLLTQILTYLLTKNSLCVVIFQKLIHSTLSPQNLLR